MERGRGTDLHEKTCIRCTKPASIEKLTMTFSEYIEVVERHIIADRTSPVESVVYLCHSCADYELSVK